MKKHLLPSLILTSLTLFTLSSLRAEVREWTQAATGNKLKAEFVKMKDEKTVTIKLVNGRTADVPVASLSDADQTYIKEKSAKADSKASMEKKKDGKKGSDGKKPELPKGEVTVVLSGVHICCKSCVKDVAAIKDVKKFRLDEKVEIEADKGGKTITVKAPSGEEAQRALDAIVASGFYGKSDNEAVLIDKPRGSKNPDFKSNIMTVVEQHMCCGGCIKAAKKAIAGVEGVDMDALEIEKGDTRFYVKGTDFKPYDVIMALRAAGFGGKSQ